MLKDNSCVTPYGEEGNCVQPSLCRSILLAFDTMINQAPQILQDSKCGCDVGKVCCGPSIQKTYKQRNCHPPTQENITIARISDSSICGVDKSITARIQGGDIADFGEFPWLVAIESKSKYKNDSSGIRCGGSIISKRYILTAAHCIAHHEFVPTRVWLGVINISPEGNCLNVNGNPQCVDSVKKMNIEETLPHPEYKRVDNSNDIGLVVVENEIDYSEYIRPICLPSPDTPTPSPGILMTVAGWGATAEKGTGSNLQLKVQLPVQNHGVCNKFLNTASIEISAKQLCVGGEYGKDSCLGDSGGPLMKDFINENGDSQWYQGGIVSYGHACGRTGRPAVYTKVSSYSQWIYKMVNNQQLDLEKRSVCTTPNGRVGTCVPLSTCKEVFTKVATKVEDGYSFATESRCGYENETLVCCEYPGRSILPNFDSTALPNTSACGVVKDEARIVGGTLAGLGEFPWVVAIEYTSEFTNRNDGIRCGGSVINSRYVLTAGQCVSAKLSKPTTVWVGDWNLSTDPDCKELLANKECADPVQKIPIKKSIPHLFFDRERNENDIGLLLLENAIKFSDYVSPICLPSLTLPPLELGTRLTVIGWGKTELGNTSDILRKVVMPLVSNEICVNILQRNGVRNIKISSQELCASGEYGNDTCVGDGGGPLMRIYENKTDGTIKWYQEGLPTFGSRSCRALFPAVYTRISSYSNWIISIISED